MPVKPLSVTEVSAYIKALLDRDEILGQLCVHGELSNYKIHSSGHHYFTLKDDGAVINAVMFRGDASRLPFRPENGKSDPAGSGIRRESEATAKASAAA